MKGGPGQCANTSRDLGHHLPEQETAVPTFNTSASHDITPVKGSARKLDGTPADLNKPMDYPVEAVCLECGRPIREERWFLGEWRHIERFSDPH